MHRFPPNSQLRGSRMKTSNAWRIAHFSLVLLALTFGLLEPVSAGRANRRGKNNQNERAARAERAKQNDLAIQAALPQRDDRPARADSIPAFAGHIRFYEPGDAPPHVVLGVVHTYRRRGQKTEHIYENTALKSKAYGGNIVVNAIAGEDDPLSEGYSMWVLGLAARTLETVAEEDSLARCENCLVPWRFDASESGETDSTVLAQLETKAFATARLQLAKNGYYLQRASKSPLQAGDFGDFGADDSLSLSLELSIIRTPIDEARDSLCFSARMAWDQSDETFWDFSQDRVIANINQIEFTGKDRNLTHNALSGVYKRLPSQYADSDGDGVVDSRDIERNTRPGYQVDLVGRTLDSDGDGVPNTIDDQPFTIAKYRLMVGSSGVPALNNDADYDGVPDSADQCDSTNVRYEVDNHGCPVLISAIVDTLVNHKVLRERRILFNTSEASLLDSSTARLDSLGEALSGLPELRFNINGHCDDRGTDELNQQLSEERAKAVADYLVKKFEGLTSDQFKVHGYGKTLPIAAGTDSIARQLNRRVEITVQNPEDAIRQVEGTRFRLRYEAVDGYQYGS